MVEDAFLLMSSCYSVTVLNTYIDVTWTPPFHLSLESRFLESLNLLNQWEVPPKTFFWNPNFLKMHWLIFQKHFIYSNALEGNDTAFKSIFAIILQKVTVATHETVASVMMGH